MKSLKYIILISCIIGISFCAKTCIQHTEYECSDNEYCVTQQDQVKCCPLKGIACSNSNTCCPLYAPTCFDDQKTCGFGKTKAYQVYIQSELKPAKLKANNQEDTSIFLKLVQNVQQSYSNQSNQQDQQNQQTQSNIVTTSNEGKTNPEVIQSKISQLSLSKTQSFIGLGLIALIAVAGVVIYKFNS